LRCGQNVDHFGFRPRFIWTARQGPAETIGQTGYLSINAAAWQPSRTAPERLQGRSIETQGSVRRGFAQLRDTGSIRPIESERFYNG